MASDLDALVEAYKAGTSASALARKAEVSVWLILDRLRKAGVEIRSNKQQNERRLERHGWFEEEDLLGLVDGVLLGDGSIDSKGSLRLEQENSRKGWLEDVSQWLETFGSSFRMLARPAKKRVIEGCLIRGRAATLLYTPCYVEFQQQRQRWYPRGIKRVPHDLIVSPLSLAYWFCGDGTYDRQGALFFCTNGFLKKEVVRLAQVLTGIGVRARCKPLAREGEWQIAITRRDDSLRFQTYVQAHVPECFQYKFQHVRAAIPRGSAQAKLTNAQAAEIRSRYEGGERQTVLAVAFGVTPSAIGRIVRGEVHQEKGKS